MPMLKNGDMLPKFETPRVGGGAISLPGDLSGAYGVALIYRGAWCPFCQAQLADFAAHKAALDGAGVKIVALSVDDEATGAGLIEKLHLPFPLGHSANADIVAAATGAYTNASPHFLQPTGFVLAPDGTVINAVYSSSALGRLSAADVVKFVTYVKSKAA